MAVIRPFRAVRPQPAVAAQVAAVPYDVVDTEEARALAAGNPLSFLHVSRAEIDLPEGTDPHADIVYRTAADRYRALKRDAPLLQEDEAALYLYQLHADGHTQTGVAACYSLAEYDRDVIKKHERTRRDKEDDRTRHIIELRAQTGPVFLLHEPSPGVDRVVQRTTGGPPLFDFTAVDGVQHSVWRVAANDERELIAAFGAIPALYIADGHHRAASAARTRQHLREGIGDRGSGIGDRPPAESDRFLAVAFPGAQTQILPYNRVVKDLGSYTPESFLTALRQRLAVKPGPATPARKGDVAMFLSGAWHTLEMTPAPAGTDP